MSALLPRGTGELFYGSMLMELYDNDIPRNGLVARMPIFSGNVADDRTDVDALADLIANRLALHERGTNGSVKIRQ